MDFLLESQKKNKNWVLLRQILLLFLRTIAVAAVVLMLAGPFIQSNWASLFGSGTTHHVILLDDSYSMSDHNGRVVVFDEAKRAIRVLLDKAVSQEGRQKLTFMSFSQSSFSDSFSLKGFGKEMNDTFLASFFGDLERMEVSETDAGPLQCLKTALGLPEPIEGEMRVAYLISDFRSLQWKGDSEIEQAVARFRNQVDQMHMIQCAEEIRPNLAITELKPESGVRAAGVETWMNLTLKNYSDRSATNVIASVSQDGHRLPAVSFDEIPAGEEVTRRFRTVFLNPGSHQLQASLESDAVDTDNTRYFACQIPVEFPVLLIDGSRDGDDGYYLKTALNPGGSSKPGWNPQVERPEYLRKHGVLSEFASICLLNVPRLDATEVEALQNYVDQGGGLAIFLGSQVQREFYNESLYRDGTGLLPVILDVPTQLLSASARTSSDIVVSEHPLFRVFRDERNSFLEMVSVNLYYGIDREWEPPANGETRVLAELRNGAPYIIEKEFGEGRVLLQLSKLSPKGTRIGAWSNWSVIPVFPVYAHEMVGYLSATRRRADLKKVGDELELRVPEAEYEPEVSVQIPQSLDAHSETLIPQAQEGELVAAAGVGKRSGIWQFTLQKRGAGVEKRLMAVNVPTGEGDLDCLDREGLAQRLEGVDYDFTLVSQMQDSETRFAGYQLKDSLLYLLLAVLLVEQWLAHQISYLST